MRLISDDIQYMELTKEQIDNWNNYLGPLHKYLQNLEERYGVPDTEEKQLMFLSKMSIESISILRRNYMK